MNELLQALLQPLQEGARSSLDALQQDFSALAKGNAPTQAQKALIQAMVMGPASPVLPRMGFARVNPETLEILSQKLTPAVSPITHAMKALEGRFPALGKMADDLGGGFVDLLEPRRIKEFGDRLREWNPYGLK